jgi:hypothetical protein
MISGGTGDDKIAGKSGADILFGGAGDDEFDFEVGSSTLTSMDAINDFQPNAADGHNDKIDNITGSVGANTASAVDVKGAIASGNGSETVTASVANGIVTLSGSDSNLINSLSEWVSVISTAGIISKAQDDADSIGTVGFQFDGSTYIVESNDTFDNNTANVAIVSFIQLYSLTGVTALAPEAAANTVVIA